MEYILWENLGLDMSSKKQIQWLSFVCSYNLLRKKNGWQNEGAVREQKNIRMAMRCCSKHTKVTPSHMLEVPVFCCSSRCSSPKNKSWGIVVSWLLFTWLEWACMHVVVSVRVKVWSNTGKFKNRKEKRKSPFPPSPKYTEIKIDKNTW